MEENKDFVIDTEMPITPISAEDSSAESKVEESLTTEDVTPTVEEPVTNDCSDNSPESESVESHENETSVPAQEDSSLSIADLVTLIESLHNKFDEKIAVDEYKNGLFDKLYKERDEYKNDIYAKLLKPFIIGSIDIINDLRSFISKMDSFEVERSLNYLKTLPDDIIELLEDNGVELYSDESESFNPRTQRAKKIVSTEDSTLNNMIAERVEKGYRWNGVILRPEMVVVYKIKI